MKNQIPETLYDFSRFLINESDCISNPDELINALKKYIQFRGLESKLDEPINTPDYNTIHNI